MEAQTQVTAEQMTDMLLVLDKNENRIRAVKGITGNGELEAVEPTRRNEPQFMQVDKHGDILSNFFGNFLRQLKEPTRFEFFRVPFETAVKIAKELQVHLNALGMDAQRLLSKYALNNEYQYKNHINMETTQTTPDTGEYRYKPEQINWETLSNLGLSKERLEKLNLLDPLLKGYKTNELVPITLTMGSVVAKLDARLSLQTTDSGQVVVAMHGIRKEPNLNYPFFGHEFTKEDKDNLLKTGNMGRVVELHNQKTGENIPSIISVDRKTNELVALRTEWIKIPDDIKGVKLDADQKAILQEGKQLYLEGMLSKKGEPFDATVQFNADKRYVEFLFDRSQSTTQAQSQGQQTGEAPRNFRGKDLTDEQYNKLSDGHTVYISGLVDKQGKEYNGYITFNKENGKTGFAFDNPNTAKGHTQPAEANKTQVAVNLEGKTNEAIKNNKEALKSDQQGSDSSKQMEDQSQGQAKGKGRKM